MSSLRMRVSILTPTVPWPPVAGGNHGEGLRGAAPGFGTAPCSPALACGRLAAATRLDALLLGVLRRRGLVRRTQPRPVWLDEIGDGRPLADVPQLNNRSEERRVGKGSVRPCRYGCPQNP